MNSTVQAPAASALPDCVPPRRLKLSACFDRLLRKALRLLPGPGRRRSTSSLRYPTRTNVVGYVERRSPALLEAGRALEQQRIDQAVEREYRRRVALNWKERARVLQVPRAWLSPTNPKPGMLSRQAD